jgi:hypothetical protein
MRVGAWLAVRCASFHVCQLSQAGYFTQNPVVGVMGMLQQLSSHLQ